ncbi:MAG: cytochrome P450 [Actinomycetota bacterium]
MASIEHSPDTTGHDTATASAETEAIDWATDFDLGDSRYESSPYEIWDELRSSCPIARTERRGGAWLPTTYDDVAAIAYDTHNFSSRRTNVLPEPPGSTLLVAPPITSDPPFHTKARRLLLEYFSPKRIEPLEAKTRSICTELVDAIEAQGSPTADAAALYAQHIPVRIIAYMLGIPEEDEARFTGWAVRIFQEGIDDPDVVRDAIKEVLAYFEAQVADRRLEPKDDLLTDLLAKDLDGDPLTNKHLLGTCFLLLMAGIDTTWSGIGASLWHLATQPGDRDRLVAEPELLPTAVEEFLRAYSPVTMAREVISDVEVNGCPMHAGDRVLLNFPAGNRDPEKFDRADEVLIDRQKNRHFAFGIGIHRCLGSNVARMEMRVAIEVWLSRFPNFAIDPDVEVRWGGAQVRGPRQVPVILDASA